MECLSWTSAPCAILSRWSRQQSFTRAAENLYVTQPTISKMVKQLEEELGMPLFIREGRSFRLTDAGHVAFERGQEVLAAMTRMKTALSDLASLERGELVVGLPPMSGSAFFAPVVSSFRERYPNIELKVVEDGALAIENSVRTGQLEIGSAVLPVNPQEFDHFGFARDHLCLVAPAGSQVAAPRVGQTDRYRRLPDCVVSGRLHI